MKNVTKEKGDIGVGYVIADLLSKSIHVCLPISEHLPFDLVACFPNEVLKRISVKYRKMNENGSIEIPFRSIYSNSKGCHVKKLDKDSIDLFAVYCPDTGKVYYFNAKDFKSGVSLRVTPVGKNDRNRKRMNMGDDYLIPFV